MEFETNHTDQIHDAKFDFFGGLVATASSDQIVKVFESLNEKSLNHVQDLQGHKGPVWRVAWAHPRFGKVLASCGYAGQLIIWRETAPGSWSRIIEDCSFDCSVNDLAFFPQEYGLVILAGSADGWIHFYKYLDDKKEFKKNSFLAHAFGVNSVSVAPYDASQPIRFATAACDNMVKFWALKDKKIPENLSEKNITEEKTEPGAMHNDWVRCVAWAPLSISGHRLAASCSEDGEVKLWGFKPKEALWTEKANIKLGQATSCISWSSMGNRLAVKEKGGRVCVVEETKDGGLRVVEDPESCN